MKSKRQKQAIKTHFFISGRVQKVGFRFFAQQKATSLGLRGWIRNLTDGRVEAEVFGDSVQTDKFINWLINTGSPLSRVDDVLIADQDKVENYPLLGFEIKATN